MTVYVDGIFRRFVMGSVEGKPKLRVAGNPDENGIVHATQTRSLGVSYSLGDEVPVMIDGQEYRGMVESAIRLSRMRPTIYSIKLNTGEIPAKEMKKEERI